VFFSLFFNPMPEATHYKNSSDDALLVLYREEGSLDVAGELYNRYMPLVYGVCLKYLKDREESRDAVMQLFEKLVTVLREHEVANFKSWLYVTARNHCLMQLRAQKSRQQKEMPDFLMENAVALHPEEAPETEANLSKLEKCIETLAPEQKQCVQLFYLKQLCYKEIVQATGFEDTRVKSYIQNGKRNLKICMEQHG
jgi:RNA polymerase sigma-70 factor (ECF subfamily)